MPSAFPSHLTMPDGSRAPLSVKRKAVRRLSLRILPDGSLILSVPRRVSDAYALAFLARELPRIDARRRGLLGRPHAPVYLDARDGETISRFGSPLTVRITAGERPGCVERDGTLFVILPDPADDEARRKLLRRRQDEDVRAEMTAQCTAAYPCFSLHGVAYPTVTVNHTRAQWGSCLPDKNELHFSSALFFAPRRFLTYVAVHEMAHLLCRDHSPAFYALVEEAMPDYREARRLAPVLGSPACETEEEKENEE